MLSDDCLFSYKIGIFKRVFRDKWVWELLSPSKSQTAYIVVLIYSVSGILDESKLNQSLMKVDAEAKVLTVVAAPHIRLHTQWRISH